MEKIFEREYYLRTSDFDKNRQILPSSVLDLFQDAAGAHAKTLNCGYDALISQSLVWVLTRVRYTR
ncbi:MAG: thioesterase, partial [Acutalibacteraceae bacterium]|nr:thioesterase [Acutalibacteraceae bacterium]